MEDIDNGRSEARNKVLANLFKELDLIEKWGSGIKRIKSLCRKQNLKEPLIEEKNDFVNVDFFRPDKNIKFDEGVNEGVNKGVNQLYTIIKKYPNKKTPFFSKELNTSVKNIERWIKRLKKEDKIEFKGSPKTGGYYERN